MKVAILSGSVYGTAEDVARHAEHQLKAAGFETWHDPRAQLPQILEFAPEALLVVTSTTGMVSCRTASFRCTRQFAISFPPERFARRRHRPWRCQLR